MSAVANGPSFGQLNLIVADMDATVAFYRRLGLAVPAHAGDAHVEIPLAGGIFLELDTADSVRHWDSGWPGTTGGANVLGFALASRDAVDELHAALVEAGARDRQPPYDAFWGARYAIVEDPDGNPVGLMSPIEDARRFWPPQPPPARS